MEPSGIQTKFEGHDRIRDHSSGHVNEQIDLQTRARIQEYAEASREEIGRRLAELDREWDVDRALMANFAVLGGLSLSLGLRRIRPFRKRNSWLYLFGTQMGFLLMHAIAGWCPPALVFRRLGFRTSKEIGVERMALLNMLHGQQTGSTQVRA